MHNRLRLKVVVRLFLQYLQYLVRTRNDIGKVRGTYLLRGADSASSVFDRQGAPKRGGRMVGWSTVGVWGNLTTALRKAESEAKLVVAFASGI